MYRLLATVFPLLLSSLAYAIDQTEQPVETSTTGIVVFVVAAVICVAIFGWYMWKNEKKSDEEKLGDKF
jgi:nicotinamide riboside transporter PnuC